MTKITLWQIFLTFAKMGLLTFGGGYAMLPILQNEVVDKKKWASQEDLLNYYAISQCTPGIIAVNAASFIGYKLRGISGLISATFGLIIPPLSIILLIAALLRQYIDNPYVQHAFGGIRICVLALIINMVFSMCRYSVKNIYDFMVFIAATILLFVFNLSAIMVVLAAISFAIVQCIASEKKP